MRFLSLFSGIEAASVAWGPLGWEPVAFSEVEPFPNAVLERHCPKVPNIGDITQITEADIAALGPIDIVVFGSPCQDLSVAGQRKGFQGERSHLFFHAMDVVRWAQRHGGCRWALWENVPGALSANRGADFGSVVGALAGLDDVETPKDGWGKEGAAVGNHGLVEWSVLDAQWFGVAQRRRRVFALADFGDWPNRPPVLLEPEGLRGDSAPSREPGERAAPTISARTKGGGGLGTDTECDGGLIPQGADCFNGEVTGQVSATLGVAGSPINSAGPQALVPFDTSQITSKTNRCQPRDGSPCHPLAAGAHAPAVAYGGNNTRGPIDVATACNANGGSGRMDFETETFPVHGMAVRRLTPREAERLQGFPDSYTAIPWRGKPASECPDGPRYKALGNSMAVPVVRWIGERIEAVQRIEADDGA